MLPVNVSRRTLSQVSGQPISPVTDRTLFEFLSKSAANHPGAAAICALDRSPLSHAALAAQIRSIGATLEGIGIGSRDRVAVVMPDGPQMAVLCLGVCCSAACAPLNPANTRPEFEYLLDSLGCTLLVVESGSNSVAIDAARTVGVRIAESISKDDCPAGTITLRMTPSQSKAPWKHPLNPALRTLTSSSIAFILQTSGSTAQPKTVPLTHANVIASAANVAQSLSLTSTDRCLAALPLYHIGGLVDLLVAPLSVGGSVIGASDKSFETFSACVRQCAPTWYQGVPAMLNDIADNADGDNACFGLHGLRFVRSVSAPLPEPIRKRFEKRFGVPVIEMYGMTETTGLIASEALPPAPHRPGSVGRVHGPKVIILDEDGNAAAPGKRGEVMVCGDTVTSGYEGTADTDETSFFGAWFRTGDEGYFDEGGFLFLTGRIKDIINRGGEKISSRQLDEVALDHPGVRDAACFPIPHPSLGEQVAIAVVAKEALTTSEITHWFEQRVSPYKVPRVVRLMEALPRTAGGKLQRQKLSEAYAERADHSEDKVFVAPKSQLAKEIAEIWEKVLGISPIGLHDDFFDLGGDSLKAATFVQALLPSDTELLEIASIYDAPTIAQFESLLRRARAVAPLGRQAIGPTPSHKLAPQYLAELRARLTGWRGERLTPDALIVGMNTVGSRTPIFWCSNGFGDQVSFARALGPGQPLYAMCSLNGMSWKSQENIEKVSALYFDELKRIQATGPYVVGGFCDGGKIAFELAGQLRESGDEVTLLAMIDMFVDKPYADRVALFLSREQQEPTYQQFARYAHPERGWTKRYTGAVSIRPANWHHKRFFTADNVVAFTKQLLEEIDLAHRGVSSPFTYEPPHGQSRLRQILPDEAYRSGIRGLVPMQLYPAEEKILRITVKNESRVLWEPTNVSGIQVQSRWQNQNNFSARVPLDGRAVISTTLAAGAKTKVDLTIRAPQSPGRWHLLIDLVDEGITPFPNKGAAFGRRAIYVETSNSWRRLVRRPLHRRQFRLQPP